MAGGCGAVRTLPYRTLFRKMFEQDRKRAGFRGRTGRVA